MTSVILLIIKYGPVHRGVVFVWVGCPLGTIRNIRSPGEYSMCVCLESYFSFRLVCADDVRFRAISLALSKLVDGELNEGVESVPKRRYSGENPVVSCGVRL